MRPEARDPHAQRHHRTERVEVLPWQREHRQVLCSSAAIHIGLIGRETTGFRLWGGEERTFLLQYARHPEAPRRVWLKLKLDGSVIKVIEM